MKAGFLAPQMAGFYIEGAEFKVEGWRHVWTTSSLVCSLGGLFYGLTASGTKQPWSEKSMSVRDQLSFEWKQLTFTKQTQKEDKSSSELHDY